jgi:hypothetical protein
MLSGLTIIALNPGVPSLGYAAMWFAIMSIARAVALLFPWLSVTIDLALLPVCFIGLEIGGLILVPSLVAFAVGDALPAPHHQLT